VLYTAIIGLGMYITYHLNGVTYGNPEMVQTLWVIEIILSSLTIFITVKYFSWQEVGFAKLQTKQMLWLIPSFALVGFMGVKVFSLLIESNLSEEKLNLVYLVGFTTLLVGFSEELMYRGILLNELLKTYGKTKAVLISAAGFSLLHSVNIFGGLHFPQMLQQLLLTFIFGLFLALIFLRIKNIIPLIIFHWLWDFSLISAGILKPRPHELESVATTSAIHIGIEIILIIALLITQIFYDRKKRDRSFDQAL